MVGGLDWLREYFRGAMWVQLCCGCGIRLYVWFWWLVFVGRMWVVYCGWWIGVVVPFPFSPLG